MKSLFLKSFITADVEDTQGALNRLKFAVDLAESQLKVLVPELISLHQILEKGLDPTDSTKKLENKEELVNRSLDIRIAFADGLYMLAILQMTRDMKIKGVRLFHFLTQRHSI